MIDRSRVKRVMTRFSQRVEGTLCIKEGSKPVQCGLNRVMTTRSHKILTPHDDERTMGACGWVRACGFVRLQRFTHNPQDFVTPMIFQLSQHSSSAAEARYGVVSWESSSACSRVSKSATAAFRAMYGIQRLGGTEEHVLCRTHHHNSLMIGWRISSSLAREFPPRGHLDPIAFFWLS